MERGGLGSRGDPAHPSRAAPGHERKIRKGFLRGDTPRAPRQALRPAPAFGLACGSMGGAAPCTTCRAVCPRLGTEDAVAGVKNGPNGPVLYDLLMEMGMQRRTV